MRFCSELILRMAVLASAGRRRCQALKASPQDPAGAKRLAVSVVRADARTGRLVRTIEWVEPSAGESAKRMTTRPPVSGP